MTEQELNQVRVLNQAIKNLERHISVLKKTAEDIVPVLDGLPHSTEIKSKVERLGVLIVDGERELIALRTQFCNAYVNLINQIKRSKLNQQEQTVLILRYVVCMNFRDIQFLMECSDRKTYSIHHDAVEKICAVKCS